MYAPKGISQSSVMARSERDHSILNNITAKGIIHSSITAQHAMWPFTKILWPLVKYKRMNCGTYFDIILSAGLKNICSVSIDQQFTSLNSTFNCSFYIRYDHRYSNVLNCTVTNKLSNSLVTTYPVAVYLPLLGPSFSSFSFQLEWGLVVRISSSYPKQMTNWTCKKTRPIRH